MSKEGHLSEKGVLLPYVISYFRVFVVNVNRYELVGCHVRRLRRHVRRGRLPGMAEPGVANRKQRPDRHRSGVAAATAAARSEVVTLTCPRKRGTWHRAGLVPERREPVKAAGSRSADAGSTSYQGLQRLIRETRAASPVHTHALALLLPVPGRICIAAPWDGQDQRAIWGSRPVAWGRGIRCPRNRQSAQLKSEMPRDHSPCSQRRWPPHRGNSPRQRRRRRK